MTINRGLFQTCWTFKPPSLNNAPLPIPQFHRFAYHCQLYRLFFHHFQCHLLVFKMSSVNTVCLIQSFFARLLLTIMTFCHVFLEGHEHCTIMILYLNSACCLQIWRGCNKILAVDVDDITIAGNSPKAVKRLKEDLGSRYGIKDMGNLWWLLGIGIERN